MIDPSRMSAEQAVPSAVQEARCGGVWYSWWVPNGSSIRLEVEISSHVGSQRMSSRCGDIASRRGLYHRTYSSHISRAFPFLVLCCSDFMLPVLLRLTATFRALQVWHVVVCRIFMLSLVEVQ